MIRKIKIKKRKKNSPNPNLKIKLNHRKVSQNLFKRKSENQKET